MEFKSRLKRLREEKGLSFEQLGGILGKSDWAVRSWESGKNKPDFKTLLKLVELFGCSSDYLLGLDNNLNKTQLEEYKNEKYKFINKLDKLDGKERKQLLDIFNNIMTLNDCPVFPNIDTEFTLLDMLIDILDNINSSFELLQSNYDEMRFILSAIFSIRENCEHSEDIINLIHRSILRCLYVKYDKEINENLKYFKKS